MYKYWLWAFLFPVDHEKVPAARAEEDHLNTSIQRCGDKSLTTDLGGEGCGGASFAHFCRVSTPSVAEFELPVWCH